MAVQWHMCLLGASGTRRVLHVVFLVHLLMQHRRLPCERGWRAGSAGRVKVVVHCESSVFALQTVGCRTCCV